MKLWIRKACVLFLLLPVAAWAGEIWLPVKDVSLAIEPDSVLDEAAIAEKYPALI